MECSSKLSAMSSAGRGMSFSAMVFAFAIVIMCNPIAVYAKERVLRKPLPEFSLTVGGVERWTSVYQPPGFQAGNPVIVLLHGGTQSMREIFQRGGGTNQWLDIAKRERVLLLVPNATNADTGDAKGDDQHWNDLRPADTNDKSNADDVGFLLALLDWAQEKYRYDKNRVYVTGSSNGGMMSMRLLIERPERFAAGAAFVASLPAQFTLEPSVGSPVPLFLLNGKADPLIRWDGGEIRGERGETMAVEKNVGWWRAHNGVADVAGQEQALPDANPKNKCRITRTTWRAPNAQSADIEFYRVDGGGHSVPAIAHPSYAGVLLRRLIGPECDDAEGAELAWTFLQSHRLTKN